MNKYIDAERFARIFSETINNISPFSLPSGWDIQVNIPNEEYEILREQIEKLLKYQNRINDIEMVSIKIHGVKFVAKQEVKCNEQ